jgi:hypothetical protein
LRLHFTWRACRVIPHPAAAGAAVEVPPLIGIAAVSASRVAGWQFSPDCDLPGGMPPAHDCSSVCVGTLHHFPTQTLHRLPARTARAQGMGEWEVGRSGAGRGPSTAIFMSCSHGSWDHSRGLVGTALVKVLQAWSKYVQNMAGGGAPADPLQPTRGCCMNGQQVLVCTVGGSGFKWFIPSKLFCHCRQACRGCRTGAAHQCCLCIACQASADKLLFTGRQACMPSVCSIAQSLPQSQGAHWCWLAVQQQASKLVYAAMVVIRQGCG